MNKNTLLLVLLTTMAVYAGPNFYVNTGISKPFAPESFSGNYHTGYELGGGIGFMSTEQFEIVPGIHYNNFSLNDANFIADFLGKDNAYAAVTGGTAHLYDVGVDLKYLVPTQNVKKVTPYVVAGAGLASRIITAKEIITQDQTIIDAEQTTHTAWAGGGIGFEILMGGNTYFMVEGRFNVLFTDKTTVFAPIKLGIIIK